MTAMLKNVRTWLVAASVAWLGLGAAAWATNPPYNEPPCADSGECEKKCDPVDEPQDSSSSCSDCGSGASSNEGSANTSNESIDVDIIAGIAPHGEMAIGRLRLYAAQPYPGLFSPDSLTFSHPVMESAILSVKTSGLAAGIACEVVVVLTTR